MQKVPTDSPLWGRAPVVRANTTVQIVALTGWNVTTQAMQRQTLNGSPVPGTTLPVPGSTQAANFQRNTGGPRPAVGSYTEPWR
jgi:hypothetical protein